MNIQHYIIDLRGSTLADRLWLRQVLHDNEESISLTTRAFCIDNRNKSFYFSPLQLLWTGTNVKANISLKNFINKFIVQDELRGLAFYKHSGKPWTNDENEQIIRFINNQHQLGNCDWGNVNKAFKFVYDNRSPKIYMASWNSQNTDHCLKVAYEDVFPEPQVEPLLPFNKPTCSTEPTQQTTKEPTMNKLDLKLLVALMSALPNEETPKDATNSQFVGIMTDTNNNYLEYVYADTEAELSEIIAQPANEGNVLHVFNYSTSLTQKPRKVIKVNRN